MKKNRSLKLTMGRNSRSGWNYVLQKGFTVSGHAGKTVREFLNTSLGYDDQSIDADVRTIFLNNSPVDDIDTIHIKDGDRLALGSAMPGLVGIVMGRDNPYKSFREDISVTEETVESSADDIVVFVKIFSTLAVDTGEEVLQRGIAVDARLLADHLRKAASHVLDADGRSVEDVIAQLEALDGPVPITVLFE